MASKRGYGACLSCKKEYSNRKKPRYCTCGFEVGGLYEPSSPQEKVTPPPKSVTVFKFESSGGSLRSVKLTPNDDRQFVLVTDADKICYVQDCLQLRAASNVSGRLSEFTCKHIRITPQDPIYQAMFSDEKINLFTPDAEVRKDMKQSQISAFKNGPSVVKVSCNSYAVTGPISTTSSLSYVHVKKEFDKTSAQSRLKCMGMECRKKIGRTKQAKQNQTCVHLHLVILARQLKEGISNEDAKGDNVATKPRTSVSLNKEDNLSQSSKLAIKIQLQYQIPYHIPPAIVSMSDKFSFSEVLPCFEPSEVQCKQCEFNLSQAMFPQGCSSVNGNGILLTNKNPFMKINIKLKKCLSENCGAVNVIFPFNEGITLDFFKSLDYVG